MEGIRATWEGSRIYHLTRIAKHDGFAIEFNEARVNRDLSKEQAEHLEQLENIRYKTLASTIQW